MKNIFITFATILLFAPASRAQWTNWQSAEFVIGQPDFTTTTSARSATGMGGPYSVAIDLQHSKLYVGDPDNNRILRYAYPHHGEWADSRNGLRSTKLHIRQCAGFLYEVGVVA